LHIRKRANGPNVFDDQGEHGDLAGLGAEIEFVTQKLDYYGGAAEAARHSIEEPGLWTATQTGKTEAKPMYKPLQSIDGCESDRRLQYDGNSRSWTQPPDTSEVHFQANDEQQKHQTDVGNLLNKVYRMSEDMSCKYPDK
jgi:hypothetical protein